MNGWRCFAIKSVVRPGQEVKWPFWIARSKVEVTGLKSVPFKKEANSDLVALDRMALEARDELET